MTEAELAEDNLFKAAVSYSLRKGRLKAEGDVDSEQSRSTSQSFVLAAADGRVIDRIPLALIRHEAQKKDAARLASPPQEPSVAMSLEETNNKSNEFKPDLLKQCPGCGKSLPSQDLKPGYQVCTSCGWTNQEISSSNDPKPRCTVPEKKCLSKGEKAVLNVAGGCSTSIVCIIVGCVLLLIPGVGWILAGFCFFMALLSPFLGGAAALGIGNSFSYDYELAGECPYCANSVSAQLNDKSEGSIIVKCKVCQESVLIKGDVFYTIVKRYTV